MLTAQRFKMRELHARPSHYWLGVPTDPALPLEPQNFTSSRTLDRAISPTARTLSSDSISSQGDSVRDSVGCPLSRNSSFDLLPQPAYLHASASSRQSSPHLIWCLEGSNRTFASSRLKSGASFGSSGFSSDNDSDESDEGHVLTARSACAAETEAESRRSPHSAKDGISLTLTSGSLREFSPAALAFARMMQSIPELGTSAGKFN